MSQTRQDTGILARRRIVRKYKLLGYEVLENPESDFLPEFMHGVRPDIVAQSKSDNVVIEVKKSSSLKGSNDLVRIAERISNHPEWRFELVVLDEDEQTRIANPATIYDSLLKKFQIATSTHLSGMAYTYLTYILVMIAHDLARKYSIKFKDRTDENLFTDLGFRGVLPASLTQECLSVLSARNNLIHMLEEGGDPSEADLRHLLQLCEQMKAFL